MLTRSRSWEAFKDRVNTNKFVGLTKRSTSGTKNYLRSHPTTVITGLSLLLGTAVLGAAGYGIYRGVKAGVNYMSSDSSEEVLESGPISSNTKDIQEIALTTNLSEKEVKPEFRYSGTAVDPQTGKNFRFFYAENVPSLLDENTLVNEVEFRDSDNFNISYRIEDLKDKIGLDSLRAKPCSLESIVPETTIVGRNGRIAGKYTITNKDDRFAMIYKAAIEESSN